MIASMNISCAFAILLLVASSGCGRREAEERDLLESRAASRMLKFIQLHAAQFPDRPRTNLAQIGEEIGAEYPHDLHNAFKARSGLIGFTNSFYEKYVFAPSGIRDKEVDAEIVALTAQPVRDAQGQLVRILIERKIDNETNWGVRWVVEPKVQQYFTDAGAIIPPPVLVHAPASLRAVQAKPNCSFTDKVEMVFRNLAEDLGLGRNHWLTVLATVVILFLLGLAIVLLSFLWRSRHRDR